MSEQSTNTISKAGRRRVALASLLGTAIEWYDYLVFGVVAVLVFDQLFIPWLSPIAGAMAAVAALALGLVARPVGAVIFGTLGDRRGRRPALVATVMLMGVSTGVIGLLPTYQTIGLVAPALLVILRILGGISAGGEWAGAVLLSVEHAPSHEKGSAGALPQLGAPLGVLGALGAVVLSLLLPQDSFYAWGWRIPFLLAFPLSLVALYIRLRVDESPVFAAARGVSFKPGYPRGPNALGALAACLFAGGIFYLSTLFVVHFGTPDLEVPDLLFLAGAGAAAVLQVITIFIGGWLANRFAPWAVVTLSAFTVAGAVFALLAFVIVSSSAWAIMFLAFFIGLLGLPYAALGTMLVEVFEAGMRYRALAWSYSVAGVISGLLLLWIMADSTSSNATIIAVAIALMPLTGVSAIAALLIGRGSQATLASAARKTGRA